MTLAVYAFYSDNANALVKHTWERLDGVYRSFKEARDASDAGGGEQSQGDDRSALGVFNWIPKLGDYWHVFLRKLAWSRTVYWIHVRALHWRARLLTWWPFRASPDTTLPRVESTTPSGPSDSIERRPEKLRMLSLGMRLTPWAHEVSEWLVARRRRRASNEYRASPSPRPSTTSLERQSGFW